MSAGVVDLQAQVESVLGALVKAATVELTKLFERRYGVSDVDVGRTEDGKKNGTLQPLDRVSTADTKRSIGVQVDDDIYPLIDLTVPSFLSDVDCPGEREEVKAVEGCFIPPEMLLAEDNVHVDPDWSPLKEQLLPGTVEMVELSVLETEFSNDSHVQADVVLSETWTKTLTPGSTQSSPSIQKPLVIRPDPGDTTSKEKVKFVCPLIFRPESPAHRPDISEEPVKAELQQTCISPPCSPSTSDVAVTPAQVGVWERIHPPKETRNDLHMKLKLTSLDQKLHRPCAVQLVDILAVPETEMKLQVDAVGPKTGWPLPKDLRRHQGLHTGRRLCCFNSCGNGVWRLQEVVAHSRDGYTCSVCNKTFKRRKVLRRHERFHTGEKPYSCTVCSKTFVLRKSLRRHLRFHTGERPHLCTQCGKSFRLRDNLKAHLRFHTGEKPFSCVTCGKMFRIMRNLEKHKLTECESFVPSFRTIAGL